MILKPNLVRLLWACVFFLWPIIPIFGQAPDNKAIQDTEKNRGHLLAEINAAQNIFSQDSKNADKAFRLALLCYQAGEFERSEALLPPLLETTKPSNDVLFLAADLDYLFGRYDKAENTLQKVIGLNPEDQQVKVKAQTKLVFVYYQTNQYAKSADLFAGLEGKIKLPHWDLMRAFGQERPYQVVWPEGLEEAKAPFVVTDPLPIISVELQGRPIYALIDTGADTFVLDNEIAAGLGIKPIASMMGTFAGGKQAEVGFSRADSLKIGEVTIKSVPISILPTGRFSKGFAEGKYTIGGIVGTGILKQFLATIDYLNGRLVLHRSGVLLGKLAAEMKWKTATDMPFVLAMTHFMMVRQGCLDDKKGLLFFTDSGLASEAAFSAPIQTLKYAGIPIPETKVQEGAVGGAGADLPPVNFP